MSLSRYADSILDIDLLTSELDKGDSTAVSLDPAIIPSQRERSILDLVTLQPVFLSRLAGS